MLLLTGPHDPSSSPPHTSTTVALRWQVAQTTAESCTVMSAVAVPVFTRAIATSPPCRGRTQIWCEGDLTTTFGLNAAGSWLMATACAYHARGLD
eukprot:SAG25_NODE_427_length_8159_cov_9.134491_12_plen_95_part_00